MSTEKIYVGIDPGAKGAIAVICDDEVSLFDIPTLEQLMANTTVLRVLNDNRYDFECVERYSSYAA